MSPVNIWTRDVGGVRILNDLPLVNEVPIKQEETQTIATGATATFTATTFGYVNATADVPNQGVEIAAVGVVDPTNVSTTEANLINNNLTDLAYNNSSTGTINKELPGVDLGSSQALGSVDLTHWTNGTYTASNYSIQGSNDAATWTDLATGLDSSSLEGQTTNITVSGNWRYVRPFCVQGNNATFWVVSELDVFAPGVGTSEVFVDQIDTLTVSVNASGNIEITNAGAPIDVKVFYL